jgi:hypothetical protein
VTLFESAIGDQAAWPVAASREVAALVDLDPDLAESLAADRRAAARHELAVRVIGLPKGALPLDRLTAHGPADLGLLIVDGIVGRELLAHDVASMELLGTGDVVRPWDEATGISRCGSPGSRRSTPRCSSGARHVLAGSRSCRRSRSSTASTGGC